MFPFQGPQAQPQPPTTTPAQSPAQGGKWSDFLSAPENRALLLQMGVSMLTGGAGGGNFLQDVGVGLGQGLEARDRVITSQYEASTAAEEAEQKTKDAATLQGMKRQQLGLEAEDVKTRRMNAETARTAATATGKGTVEERANRAAWTKFVLKAMEDAELMDQPVPTLDELAAQWEEIGGVIPSTVKRSTPGTGVPPGTPSKVINGKTFYFINGKWQTEG